MAKNRSSVPPASTDPLDAIDDALEASLAGEATPAAEAPEEKPVEAVAAPVEAAKPDAWVSAKVLRRVTVSWGNAMIILNDGDVISDASYGPNSIQKMRDAGVALERLS